MSREDRPVVIVVGGGAAGALSTLHLLRAAARRSTSLEVVIVDPAVQLGAGTAFGTTTQAHLLNVPASGMSALPEEPGHFVAWRRTALGTAHPYEFAPRRAYATYLDETLRTQLREAGGDVTLTHLRRHAMKVDRAADGIRVGLDDGTTLHGDALVVATGLPSPGADWAPRELARSAFFIPDPWAPGALDVVVRARLGPPDVILVGTGLTMVDIALTLSRDGHPDRTVHAVSRTGKLPHRHADRMLLPVIPEVIDWGNDLATIHERALHHLAQVSADVGDWRPAVDGLRFQMSALWGRMTETDRLAFLDSHAATWNRLRHRIPPMSATHIASLVEARRLHILAGRVRNARALPRGGLRVQVTDGTAMDVGWVVNCTGPKPDVRESGNPLLDDLLRSRGGGRRLALPSTAGMGFHTIDGRLVASSGDTPAPIWVLGALRRGELWESTAIPEIRTQALSLASDVMDAVAPQRRRLADGHLVNGRHPIVGHRSLPSSAVSNG